MYKGEYDMQELIRLDIKWKKCKIPVGEFLCITGNTEPGIFAAHRIIFDAPYHVCYQISIIQRFM